MALWRALHRDSHQDEARRLALPATRRTIDRPNFRGGTRTDLRRDARSLGCSPHCCIAVNSRYLRFGVPVKNGRETGSTETVADAQFVRDSAWKSSNDFNGRLLDSHKF